MIRISRYKSTKYWSVYYTDSTGKEHLVCVTVYKKGAAKVQELLSPLSNLTPETVRVLTCPLLTHCAKAKPLNNLTH